MVDLTELQPSLFKNRIEHMKFVEKEDCIIYIWSSQKDPGVVSKQAIICRSTSKPMIKTEKESGVSLKPLMSFCTD